MTTYKASTTDEAIALAERLVADGTYQWFRGQTRDWPLRSSLQRRSGAKRDAAVQWLIRFRAWLSHTDGLWQIAADSDQATAVAQHYGIPTDFIDVTPDPSIAAFFATYEAGGNESDEPGVILCLNVDQLRKSWAERYEGFRSPELIELSVPNLWRLESQRGAFLFCPFSNVEQLYSFDRILFSRSRSLRLPSVEQIYPPQKSALEILLDQFFMLKAISEGNELLKPIAHTITLPSHEEGYDPTCFVNGRLDPLESWDAAKLRDWLAVPHEKYDATVVDEVLRIQLPFPADLVGVLRTVREFMRRALNERQDLRHRSVRFVVAGPENRLPKAVADLERLLPRLWDGLRALPYTDKEVALSFANCVGIRLGTLAHIEDASQEPADWDEAAAVHSVLGADFLVEFADTSGSYSRAYVREADLRALMRPDLYELLRPELRAEFRDDLHVLLSNVYAPERLLDFRGLAHLFATELVPIQLLMRRWIADSITFTPARLATFGLR